MLFYISYTSRIIGQEVKSTYVSMNSMDLISCLPVQGEDGNDRKGRDRVHRMGMATTGNRRDHCPFID